MKNKTFLEFLNDNIKYSIVTFEKTFEKDKYIDGFILYKKYSRKDVFRILNWKTNPLAQNVGGSIISPEKSNCPIFVNYHKSEFISNSTKYEDGFLNKFEFEWMSKSRRNLNSPDIQIIRNNNNLRLCLFVKKSNGEGDDFYYMGDMKPIDETFKLSTLKDNNNNDVSVVKVIFSMSNPVEDNIYNYITYDSIE